MSALDHRGGQRRNDFRRSFVPATQTALVLITVVVVGRRMSGAFAYAVAPAVPCVAATLATVLSLAGLALWTTAGVVASRRNVLVITLLAVLSPIALGAALWIAPSAFVGGYLTALAVVAAVGAVAIHDAAGGFVLAARVQSALAQSDSKEEWLALQACPPAISSPPERARGQAATRLTPASSVESSLPKSSATVSNDHADEKPTPSANEEIVADDSIVQSMTRRRLPDGGEVVEGAVSIDFGPGERIGVAHLSFLPPLCADPDAECHLLCDFDGRVRVAVAKSYGLRIEARRSTDSQAPATICVAFCAQAPPAASRAAAA